MTSRTVTSRTTAYRPRLAWFAAVGGAWVFVLVLLGAFTTTIGAGMVFADWPLSNGSVNPEGWLTDIAMFAEHSHRLSGTLMGLITITLAIWLWRTEARGWVRQLGWWALVIVIVQGLLGGTRVLLDPIEVPGFHMTLGQMLRIPHGVLAQLYICLLILIALAVSRPWIEARGRVFSPSVRRWGLWVTALLIAQLTIATVMRHNAAGLAIPTFPWSTPEGDWLPTFWSFRVGIHFAHRVMAVVISVVLVTWAMRLWAEAGRGTRVALGALVGLLALQIALGALTVLTLRDAHLTTAHVIVGAVLLALSFGLTCWTFHPQHAAAPATTAGRRSSQRFAHS